MTCRTTHHACDCVLRKMEKLEAVAEAAKEMIEEMRISPNSDFKLAKVLKELEK